MDFSKAFDKVGHQRLLLKVHGLGINTGMITWIQSFRSGRTQCIVLDNETSDACPVLSVVPKYSVLFADDNHVSYHLKSIRLSRPAERPIKT